MDTLAESLIGLDPETIPLPPTEDKPTEPSASLESILDDKTEESKSEKVPDSDEVTVDIDKNETNIDITIDNEQVVEGAPINLPDHIDDRIEEAKSNLSEFLKVSDDPPPNAVVLNEFEDNLESERDKIIEDLMSTTEGTGKDDMLTYTAHFDVLNADKEENKSVDVNTDEVNMDIETSLKAEEEKPEKTTEKEEKEEATLEMNVEDKIKELLVDEGDSKTDENKMPTNKLDEVTLSEVSKVVDSQDTSITTITKNDTSDKDSSKDDIDTLLSTLMPDLESSTKPDGVAAPKKQSIQYLRDVLDKPEERGKKRKISTDSESEEKTTKKIKVLPTLPEVTLTKVSAKKRRLNFDDLMSNLTKIKLPSASWKVRISAGSNPFSIVEFHEKEKLLRSVKFFKEDFQYKVLFNNLPIELLGAPEHIQSLEDVSVLLSIVNTLIKNDPVVHYL